VRVTASGVADLRGTDPDELGDQLVATYDEVVSRPVGSRP